MQPQADYKHLNLRGKIVLKEQNKIIKYLLRRDNPYQIKVGDTVINMEYSDNNITFNECMLKVLKEKLEK